LLDPLLESSNVIQSESELLATDSQSVSQSVCPVSVCVTSLSLEYLPRAYEGRFILTTSAILFSAASINLEVNENYLTF